MNETAAIRATPATAPTIPIVITGIDLVVVGVAGASIDWNWTKLEGPLSKIAATLKYLGKPGFGSRSPRKALRSE